MNYTKLAGYSLSQYLFSFLSAEVEIFYLRERTMERTSGICNICNQETFVRNVDNTIHRINHYPADIVVCFVNTYPLDSDLNDSRFSKDSKTFRARVSHV